MGRPTHQLHAQAVLLEAVVAGDLLLDLLQCGRAAGLLGRFAGILEQTRKRGWVYKSSQDSKGNGRKLPEASEPEVSSSPAQGPWLQEASICQTGCCHCC